MSGPRAYLLSAPALLAVVALACGARKPAAPADPPDDPNAVTLVFSYGSEKEKWVDAVTAEFNAKKVTAPDGKVVVVKPVALGSGECVDTLLGRADETDPKQKLAAKAHLTSPASGAFFELAAAETAKLKQPPLVAAKGTRNLVLSPVVIATWRPMAEALGWPEKPVGWADVLALATDPKGWESKAKPQFGRFKFGHTHPDLSNSGLIAMLAETYAGAGKKEGLTAADVADAKVRDFVGKIEQSTIFYGRSTGFFGKQMAKGGPGLLSAAVLYENMVIEANADAKSGKQPLEMPMVALYPREGTFLSDHPVAVVERDWVTPAHQAAAKLYIDFLMEKPQQEAAMKYGFRPGDEKVPLDPAVFSKDAGVDPLEPKAVLEVPPADVMTAIKSMWREVKKPVRVVLVIDTSGSMRADQRMIRAKAGAKEFVSLFGGRDELQILAFSSKVNWVAKDKLVMTDEGKGRATKAIDDLFADGETALYDSIAAAFSEVKASATPGRSTVVVVLTDGEDTSSKLKLGQLTEQTKFDAEGAATRIFTIAYGSSANEKILGAIAEATKAQMFPGDPRTIRKVFRLIYDEQ